MEFPDSWEVSVHNMKGGRDIGDGGIRLALQQAIGAPRLREFARGKSSAAILIRFFRSGAAMATKCHGWWFAPLGARPAVLIQVSITDDGTGLSE